MVQQGYAQPNTTSVQLFMIYLVCSCKIHGIIVVSPPPFYPDTRSKLAFIPCSSLQNKQSPSKTQPHSNKEWMIAATIIWWHEAAPTEEKSTSLYIRFELPIGWHLLRCWLEILENIGLLSKTCSWTCLSLIIVAPLPEHISTIVLTLLKPTPSKCMLGPISFAFISPENASATVLVTTGRVAYVGTLSTD